MHLDVHVPDVGAEVRRLEGLGAERVDADPIEEAGTIWVRMRDPEGNEFCVCRLEP
jgi:predicted enzyme related to lactoylglutathione lyase